MVSFRYRSLILALLSGMIPSGIQAAENVSFTRDVMAVFSRAGCNQGACHGNLNGKGGFKLSLRGEDPDFDYRILTRDLSGRRVDPFRPEESLLLRKAAGLVSHEGGPRFSADSAEYRILLNWLQSGLRRDDAALPKLAKVAVEPSKVILDETRDRFSMRVTATFADGNRREVTALCAFDSTNPTLVHIAGDGTVKRNQFGETVVLVRYLNITVAVPVAFLPARPDFKPTKTASANLIDKHLYPQWAELKLNPSVKCDDSTFLRRVSLDALGRLPSADETRKFLADTGADKRSKLIDSVLKKSEFADFWALKWSDLLRNEEKSLDAKGVRVFHQWIREAILKDKPLNEFAGELIAARGSTYANPSANLYRALREPYQRGESIAQVFLGVRLQCAKCHNHPFDVWTQEDYHRFAALFAQVDYRVLSNQPSDALDKHEFNGDQVVYMAPDKQVLNPRTGEPMAGRILGTKDLLPAGADRTGTLAAWVADPDNPFFAKAQANRVWRQLFGRGLVEPDDDFRLSNPPTNEALLNDLAANFKKNGFKLRHIVRLILNSEAYQLSSVPNETNAEDDLHFSKSAAQPLEAEQLVDALSQVSGSKMRFTGYPNGTRAVQMAAPLTSGGKRKSSAMGEKFMKVFGKPERLLTCECERSEDPGLLQSLQLINGEMVHKLIVDPANALDKVLQADWDSGRIVDELFLTAYSRMPRSAERAALVKVLDASMDRRPLLEDVLWGILNSKEFLIRR